MWTVPLGGITCVIGNTLNLELKIPFRFPLSSFKASPKSFSSLLTSGLCRASQVAELFPTISPEVYVREARVEDCWEVAETHCSSFFPEYSFPLDFVLRIDRLIAMLFGFSIPNGCKRTCLVAVVGSRDEEACLLSTEELKLGGFDGRLSLNKGYVTGILTVDTVADFLPRKGPLRQRRYKYSSSRFTARCLIAPNIQLIGDRSYHSGGYQGTHNITMSKSFTTCYRSSNSRYRDNFATNQRRRKRGTQVMEVKSVNRLKHSQVLA